MMIMMKRSLSSLICLSQYCVILLLLWAGSSAFISSVDAFHLPAAATTTTVITTPDDVGVRNNNGNCRRHNYQKLRWRGRRCLMNPPQVESSFCFPHYYSTKVKVDERSAKIEIQLEHPITTSKHDANWMEFYNKLKAYQILHGDCNVPQKRGGGGGTGTGSLDNDDNNKSDAAASASALGRWVSTQRTAFRKDCLRQDRIDLLNEIGFVWNMTKIHEQRWLSYYEELQEFQNDTGHCNVRISHGPLGRWVCNQRFVYSIGRMADDRKSRLDDIGFVWRGGERSSRQNNNNEEGKSSNNKSRRICDDHGWLEKYRMLKSYQKECGHCNVPANRSPLGIWVQNQRAFFRKGRMKQDRKARLDEIGFEWTLRGRRTS